jgi:pyridoxine 4-dehydrogenase
MPLDGPFAAARAPDRAAAVGVLRAAVAAGVDHIDTAQYYGAVNDLIREALYPYPEKLAIVSKAPPRRRLRCSGCFSSLPTCC